MFARLMPSLFAVLLLASACGSEDGDVVIVFAAASLAEAFAELEAEFEASEPGVDVQLSIGGSSSLREQILEGAPADVFASANVEVMAAIEEAGFVNAEPQIFATNELAIGVPAGNPASVEGIEDFASSERFLGLCAVGVPCGDLARDMFTSAGIVPQVDSNEPDVRALLTKIAEEELDAGVVYRSDLGRRIDIEGVAIPAKVNRSTKYPIARLADAPAPEVADRFVDFVTSPDGLSVLAEYGFGAP